MIQRVYKLLLSLSLFVGLVSILHSCGMSYQTTSQGMTRESEQSQYDREQARLRATYGAKLSDVADQMVRATSKIFSPNTGKDFKSAVNLYDYEIVENKQDGYIACYATLTWQARSWLNSYNWCELSGWLYYYPSLRRIDKPKAHFVWKTRNKHIENISDSGDWHRVEKGITIDLNE